MSRVQDRIYIDVSVLTLATFITGIQRVTREVCLAMIKEHGEDIFLLHYNAAENSYYRIDNQAFASYYAKKEGIKERMITKTKIPISDIGGGCVFFDLDAAWMCRLKRSFLLPILKKQGARIVAHIYDIISITHPQYCLERGVYNFMDYLGAHLLYADEFIVNAGATVREIEKLSKEIGWSMPKCTVVPLGADFRQVNKISAAEIPADVAEATASKTYVLMVGTIEPRKNHRILLKAYDKGLKELGYRIIFAGSMGWKMEDFRTLLENHPDYGKEIFHFEGLDDNAISFLYQHAKFVAFCSYTEGFGLPIIEAVSRGTPVLAADIPVLKEVGGEYCIWFAQDHAEEICERVREYTENTEKYDRLKQKMHQFRYVSWKETFKGIDSVLDSNA